MSVCFSGDQSTHYHMHERYTWKSCQTQKVTQAPQVLSSLCL